MPLQDTTKTRLRWFLIAMTTVAVAGVVAYVARDRQLERAAVAGRDQGLRSLEAGDFYRAMHQIGPFVRRHPEDVDAMLAYARARQNVPDPTNKHVFDSIALFRRALSLRPHDIVASEALLQLYQQQWLWTEELQLSNDLLAVEPTNRAALTGRAAALFALRRFAKDEALNAALAFTDAYPTDIDGQLRTLEILNRGDGTVSGEDSRGRVIRYCETLRTKYPQDVRFVLLTAIGHVSLGDNAAGKQWLEKACQAEMPDPASLQVLVQHLDRMGMYTRSLEVLEHSGPRGEAFAALLSRRLWQLERYADVAKQPETTIGPDAQPVALRCLALFRIGRKEESAKVAQSLKDAAGRNASARAWSEVVAAWTAGDRPDDAALIAASRKLPDNQKDPHVEFLVGKAYLRSGDVDSAMELFRRVCNEVPGWSAPLVQIGLLALSSGNFDEAAGLAQAALVRKPDNTQAMLVLARAAVMRSAAVDEAIATKVLATLNRIDELSPGEDGVGPLRVHVLAAAGRKADAVDAARRVLQAPRQSAATLIQLASVSQAMQLGLDGQCLDRCEQLHGTSAELAFARARREVDAGRGSQALESFAKSRSSSPSNAERKQAWDTAWVRLLELSGDLRAKNAWIALADASPQDPQIQWLAISARSVQGDRYFIGRVLDRLRDRVGDQGITYRLSRARWLLGGEETQNVVEAALILNDLTRSGPQMLAPRLLLAGCLVQLGNKTGAIEQLTVASNLQPQSAAISLQLAALLRSTGDASRARVHLDRVLQNPTATLAQRREAAEMLSDQGEARSALAALERAYESSTSQEPPRDVLLAKLYRDSNQLDRVDAICKRLAASSDVTELGFAADFYASQGRTDDANAVLEKLQPTKGPPGTKEIIFGSHALRTGDRAGAAAHFAAAVRLEPTNPAAWRQLARLQIMTGEGEAAVTTGANAHAALPNDPGIAAFARQAPAVMTLKARWPELLVVLSDVLDAPNEEATLTAAIDLLSGTGDAPLSGNAVNKMFSLARSKSGMFPLQLLAARVCGEAGRMDDACLLVRRAAELRVEALGMAIQMLASAQRGPELAELLRPRLKESARWRIEWMRVAGAVFENERESLAWLGEVEPLVMGGDVSERLALAESWQTLALRTEKSAIATRAAEIIQRVSVELRDRPATPEALLSLAGLQELQGDLPAAEAAYRKALELSPDLAIAQNNLAMLLARRGEGLEEALQLATRATRAAVSSDANIVSFYDTLAFVRTQRKEYDAALGTLSTALKLKPDHLWCQIRLTDVLAQTGQVDKARAALEQLDRDLPGRGTLPVEASDRLRALRARLTRPTS